MRDVRGLRPSAAKRHELTFFDGQFLIDGVAVITRDGDHFVPRRAEYLQNIFGWMAANSDRDARLRKIAQLLEEDREFEAIFIANLGNWDTDLRDEGVVGKANFNPYEPRDHEGRWTNDPSQRVNNTHAESIQYRGYFHDIVVDNLLKGLASGGSTVLKNIKVLGLNGILAIPDGVSKPTGANKPYFIEVKTGFDPDFTPNQKQVYPLICIGGHATSSDPRITQLGLTPGVPFPPLDIVLVHTYGPGLPLRIDSYCEEFVFGGSPHAP